MLKTLVPAIALAAALSTPALAIDLTRSVTIPASPEAVWKVVGGFCGIGEWHPAVEKCVLSEKAGKQQRTLSLKGGGTIHEEELSRNDAKMDYTYTILESPLPVSDYRSTLMVEKDGSGSKLTWQGTFKAKGATDAKAEEVIAGIYDGGLKGIASKVR